MIQNVIAGAVLLAFYLFLLIRWRHVRRTWAFWAGVAGMSLFLVSVDYPGRPFAAFFADIVPPANIFGLLVAFVAAVLACYPEPLPGLESQPPQQPPANRP
jgi:hypothetical protein